ncbi:undecaprenyl diphosphate synthase family protein [Eubacterium sp. MSJ-13]|uniref:undecaprenyl diphosphate synthase family protein n=1 Tax=Eubacterium sp. MSJ-13 TaxID=2841513 RepID=UPI001C10680E|nr:undecaprenyl diphosphate synthase family protein [Eubacterium sp. MSJ-13]MBU5478642.1 undecaprenyl diphosphate synthase family protein [Eubacterium sp. MSJ-13]
MKKNKLHHIGVIPDGNRRWSVAHGFSKEKGYRYGLEPGLRLLRLAKEYGIGEITFYGFTVDNCKRPHEQFEAFRDACVEAVNIMSCEGIELLVMGNTDSKCFPEELKKYTVRTSVNGGGIKVNLLVNYGWKWDLSRLKTDGEPYSSDISRIDMIIRWGGMRRLSGFLPIQSVYSDFYVEEKLWPDYEDKDFYKAVEWYKKQDVTYGG